MADSVTFLPENHSIRITRITWKTGTCCHGVHNLQEPEGHLTVPITINRVEGVKFVPEQVEIFIPIEEFTERTFEVPITATGLPASLDVKFFPSRANVSFSVTLEEYRKIVPEDFEIRLKYRDFQRNEDGRVELQLSKRPEAVQNVRISPASVEFLFENKSDR